jgi:hypothetical protein
MLKNISGSYSENADSKHLVASIFDKTIDLRPVLEELLRRPGAAVDKTPDDKRLLQDSRRILVVEHCCYIWQDAGRPLTVTTETD